MKTKKINRKIINGSYYVVGPDNLQIAVGTILKKISSGLKFLITYIKQDENNNVTDVQGIWETGEAQEISSICFLNGLFIHDFSYCKNSSGINIENLIDKYLEDKDYSLEEDEITFINKENDHCFNNSLYSCFTFLQNLLETPIKLVEREVTLFNENTNTKFILQVNGIKSLYTNSVVIWENPIHISELLFIKKK